MSSGNGAMSGSAADEGAGTPSRGVATMLRRATEALLLVGTASLVYWPTIHRGPIIVPLRAELPFALALALAAIEISLLPRRERWGALLAEAEGRWTWIALGGLLGACLFATGLSWFRYHLGFNRLGLETMLQLIFNLLIFALIYRVLRTNVGLFEKLALALFLPTLVPLGIGLLVIIDPRIHEFMTSILRLPPLVAFGQRFQGLTSNPVMGTFSSLTGIAFFFILALCGLGAGVSTAIGLASVVGGMGLLVLWAQTRSAFIALICLMAMAVTAGIRLLGRGIGQQALLVIAAAIVMVFGWRLVPAGLVPEISEARPQHLLTARLDEGLGTGGRLAIYRYYLRLLPSNVLGVGFNYERKFFVDLPHQNHPTAHSSILALWMFGGIGAVLAAGAVLLFTGMRAVRDLRAMAGRGGGIVGAAEACYLAAVIALLTYWIETTWIGSPFSTAMNSVLLAMVLAGVPPSASAAGLSTRALSVPIAWFGYVILLGLTLRAVRG